ncbi:MerR family transcriptional regulator [Corynebacterium pseudotuberculosis]|uniref:MerR family transcriptional regulator n=2 Tax=Bacteria TaxID=2 RepID=D9QEM6_CORP2|nr:MerR family transcriptional regulator [Corynebacterium pseudotuberculosis]ADK28256.2 MerR family transcriptional regulator [Corynebacterium pseudotuberculosis FRC41]ADL09949.1 MerR family transcriptional regulator [Corynebacterium pseudotuberculosis C231]ADL20354.1 MerR family transcriptional regulator [Corynebacterium pseudotuberculosis 1002]AEP69719.1 HTH-type transcriptional activator tipA [Corynebacterium pseudotuberculosis 42/02-A]AEX38935.1 HTH-type transcriptional activator tipA [Cor
MNELTIGEAAEFLGITTRALRHWDTIGLLEPQWRNHSDYRLYTEEDLTKAFTILVYREAGLSLKTIQNILEEPSTEKEHLQRQLKLLKQEIFRKESAILSVEKLLRGETSMTPQDFANAFSHDWSENYADYRDEAESRWGESEEWAASQSKVRSMSTNDWQNAQASDAAFVSELHSAWQAGVRPGSAAADRIVALHREQIDQWYESSLSKQLILAQMYVSDDRFAAHYQGLAPYLLELVRDAAQRGGVDVDNPSWV